jgi:hypothetical protein
MIAVLARPPAYSISVAWGSTETSRIISTFSKNRHGRFRESDLPRKLFETVVGRCMKEGIVGG